MRKRKQKTASESEAELVAKITSANGYGEIPTGPPGGKELLALLDTRKPLEESFPDIEDPLPESLPEFD